MSVGFSSCFPFRQHDDIKMGGNTCDGLAKANSLFNRFNFELFGITFIANEHFKVI